MDYKLALKAGLDGLELIFVSFKPDTDSLKSVKSEIGELRVYDQDGKNVELTPFQIDNKKYVPVTVKLRAYDKDGNYVENIRSFSLQFIVNKFDVPI